MTQGGTVFARQWRPAHEGSGAPAILLFHDSLGCVALWRDFPAALARASECPVIAYDRLGFGQSDPNPETLSLDFVADEAGEAVPLLQAELGFERFIAFGHSVGGGMAVGAATTFPDACLAVITMSAQAFVEDRTVAGLRAAQIVFADAGQFNRLARYHGDKTQWVLDSWLGIWLAPSFADWTLDAALPQVRCPLLALHGKRDEYGSDAHPRRISTLAGGPASMVLLDDCGHIPHREQPSQVLRHVVPFVAEIGRS